MNTKNGKVPLLAPAGARYRCEFCGKWIHVGDAFTTNETEEGIKSMVCERCRKVHGMSFLFRVIIERKKHVQFLKTLWFNNGMTV